MGGEEQKANMGSDLRQKYWSELSIEEKIERTRDHIKRLEEKLYSIDTKVNKLLRHKHLGDELVMKIETCPEYLGNIVRPSPDKVYF